MCLFQFRFPLCVCPAMGLLGHKAVLFPVLFKESPHCSPLDSYFFQLLKESKIEDIASGFQFSLVTQSCLTLCDPMDCSTPGIPVHHHLPELAQTRVHWVCDAIQPYLIPVVPFSSCLQFFPMSGSFPMSWLFALGGQNVETSASASVPSTNIQDWFPLGLTGLISLQSKGLPRVFSNTTVQKHQFLWRSAFFTVKFSHLYMTNGKTIALTRWTLVGKVMSLL